MISLSWSPVVFVGVGIWFRSFVFDTNGSALRDDAFPSGFLGMNEGVVSVSVPARILSGVSAIMSMNNAFTVSRGCGMSDFI